MSSFEPKSLCARLRWIDERLGRAPSVWSVRETLGFLYANVHQLRNAFGSCAWTYAGAPHEPQQTFVQFLTHVIHEFEFALRKYNDMARRGGRGGGGDGAWYGSAMAAWTRFLTGVSTGCCRALPDGRVGSRYVIRATPPASASRGEQICVPTLTPSKITERSYASRDECELALSFLPRNSVVLADKVTCNEYGCYQTPRVVVGARATFHG